MLVNQGYVVGAMARRVQMLNELRDEGRGMVVVKETDVIDVDSAMEALATLINEMGGVDLVVISAGVGEINNDLRWNLEDLAIKTNVNGFAGLANVAMHHFMAKGTGHLVGISSVAALRGGRASPAYNASKAFQSNYLEGLRHKVKHSCLPITITDIRPGFVKTAMAKGDGMFWAAEPDKAVRQIYQAIKRKKSHAYITRRWMLVAWLLQSMPGFVYERL